AADRLDGMVDGRVGGDDDYFEGRPLREKRTEEIQPAFLSPPQIDEREIVRQARERVDRGRRRTAFGDRATEGFQADSQRLADVAFIVHDQDAECTLAGVRLVAQCGSPGGESAPAWRLRSRPQRHSIIPANRAPRKQAAEAAATAARGPSGIGSQKQTADSASRCTSTMREAR